MELCLADSEQPSRCHQGDTGSTCTSGPQGDTASTTRPLPRVPLTADTEEFDGLRSQPSYPTEDTIGENLKKNKKSILESLKPSEPSFAQLLEDLELDGIIEGNMTREQEAEKLLSEVVGKHAYRAFLDTLEEDMEDLGHAYIVSLLKGEEFGSQNVKSESRELSRKIRQTMVEMTKRLNMDALEDHLVSAGLLTTQEQSILKSKIASEKSRLFLHWLKTKGPTAHYIFVHECLATEKQHCSHGELYRQLTNSEKQLKRKADEEDTQTTPTKLIKRSPSFLEPPEGITTLSYFQEMWDMRQLYQSGRQYWDKAEDVYRRVMSSKESSLEKKIAFLLESTYGFILSKQSKEVYARVKMARKMCSELYTHPCNAQVMVGRCEWILAKHSRYIGDYDQAISHLKEAFYLIANCAQGEEKALVNYCHGCTLVDMGLNTLEDKALAINALTMAVGCANNIEHGVKIACILRHGKIRLAQAHLGSAPKRPGGNADVVSRCSVEDAKGVLRNIDEGELDSHPRTKCIYLYTWSDVHRAEGRLDKASETAQLALEIAQQSNLKDEKHSVEMRREVIQKLLVRDSGCERCSADQMADQHTEDF